MRKVDLDELAIASIVIPVFNNQDSLVELIERLYRVSVQETSFKFEIIFVNDGSLDDSMSILRSQVDTIGAKLQMRIISFTRNFGQSAAILAGLKKASGECVVVMAADLQDEPEVIPRFLESYLKGFEIVLGIRKNRTDGKFVKLTSSLGYRLIRRKIRDYPKTGFDFYLISRLILGQITSLNENHFRYLQPEIVSLGYPVSSIEYIRKERKFGKSAHTFRSRLKFFSIAIMDESPLLLRSALVAGFFFLGVSLAIMLTLVWNFFRGNSLFEGYITLFSLVLLTGSLQIIVLGIMGEYVWRTYDYIRNRPVYVISEELPPKS